jgi:hypothetical protein
MPKQLLPRQIIEIVQSRGLTCVRIENNMYEITGVKTVAYSPTGKLSAKVNLSKAIASAFSEKPGRKKRKRSSVLKRIRRQKIYEKTPYCAYCKKQLAFSESTLDHVLPECRGGSNGLHNLVIACLPCNQEKDSMTAEEFSSYKLNKDYI